MAIGGNGENVFRRFTQAIGMPELASDPRFSDNRARIDHHKALDAIIGDWTERHTQAEIQALLDTAGVPAGPVMSIADIAADPQFQARGMIARVPDGRFASGEAVMPGIVPRLSGTPGVIRHAGGEVGADSADVLGGLLGLSQEEQARLAAEGVTAGPRGAAIADKSPET
jgi:crotonobetainyl-CoA:carnitine CoA-transferase CaiB-like acyl-CoA transferase